MNITNNNPGSLEAISLENRKLKELVSFVSGINPTRAKKQFGLESINYYDQSSFEVDYNHDNTMVEDRTNTLSQDDLTLSEGDVVISNSLQLATIVGRSNVGKVLSLNFTKIEIDNKKLDKRYFLFLFNAYKDVRRQKERELQGSGPVLRIPLRSLGEIDIPIVPLVDQKQIGDIYVEMLTLQSKLIKYGEILEQFTETIIEEKLRR